MIFCSTVYETAIELIEKADKEKIEFDIVAYTSIIKGLTKAKNWRKLEEIVQQMKVKHIKLNIYSYSALLNALVKKGDMKGGK